MVQMSKLNGLWKTQQARIFIVELKLKLRTLFHYEQIVWENSEIKLIFSQMIYAFTWDALVVEVCIRFSLFYIQIFLSEFPVRPRYFPRASVWLLCY